MSVLENQKRIVLRQKIQLRPIAADHVEIYHRPT